MEGGRDWRDLGYKRKQSTVGKGEQETHLAKHVRDRANSHLRQLSKEQEQGSWAYLLPVSLLKVMLGPYLSRTFSTVKLLRCVSFRTRSAQVLHALLYGALLQRRTWLKAWARILRARKW